MASTGTFKVKAIAVLVLALFSCLANGALSHTAVGLRNRRALGGTSGAAVTVFDVTEHGAKADDKTNNAMPFIRTWKAACESTAPAKVVIPDGTFLTGPTVFQGPCAGPVIFEVQGCVKASTDLSEYTSPEWMAFESIDGLTLTDKGTFDGQGPAVWEYNDCKSNKDCQKLPASLRFHKVNNSEVSGITSLNSMFFHYHVVKCQNVAFHHLTITAPDDSPNTDGIHISGSSCISVTDSMIGTGNDCVSIGDGTTNLTVSQVTCGPGHGISVGSLGKYPDEDDVSGILVINCTFSNTTNGARIKTYSDSDPSNACGIVYEDIIMDHVKNPIIIDQKYGIKDKEAQPSNSKVKVSDVHFRNIKGTSVSPVAVDFQCSSSFPCEGVELSDIDLTYIGDKPSIESASCSNAKVTCGGKQNPTITCT
ncbi:hypothetical protein JCGZ_21001 [Jatropha curcas]|uniref:Uncharacterized protein n=1 Tax=Jatropha curcas TaxID=180498 RepID=A0A067JTV7_JATCU|nr:hypothetical protein JCGZ_21001 [Jatropha curcas]